MRLHYITREEELEYQNFSNVVCLQLVGPSEYLMTYIDALSQLNVKRLKVDERHMITIEEV